MSDDYKVEARHPWWTNRGGTDMGGRTKAQARRRARSRLKRKDDARAAAMVAVDALQQEDR